MHTEPLLKAILGMTARQAIPEDKLVQLVGSGESQLQAFNMCDGTRGQGEIAKALGIDPGSFSRSVSRWIELGIMLRLGEGRDAKLLHVYPLSKESMKERTR